MPLFKTFFVKCSETFPSTYSITINPQVFIIIGKKIKELKEKEEKKFLLNTHGNILDKKLYPLKISIVDIISKLCEIKCFEYNVPEKVDRIVETWETHIDGRENLFLLFYSDKDLSIPFKIIKLDEKYLNKNIYSLIGRIERGELIGENINPV